MTDDTERRLRETFSDTKLPAAPESLREALHAVAESPAPIPPRRSWVGMLPAIAAVVVLAMVAAAVTGGFGRFGAVASASPTSVASAPPSGSGGPAPTASSNAPASVKVLTPVELEVAMRAVQTGSQATHVVVANVAATPMTDQAVVECGDPLGTCTEVAAIDGFGPTFRVIAVRTDDQTLPPPVTAAALEAPLALRLVAGAPTELLGHVDLQGDTGKVDTVGLKALTATEASGQVVPVLAWLSSVSGPSCGPMSTLPAPFSCPGLPSFLNDQPVAGAIVDNHPSAEPGSSITPIEVVTGNIPESAVLVQAFAYQNFAPSPVMSDGVNGEPRLGLWLVRMVNVDTAECPKCRGWLVVGRIDAEPPTASPSAAPNAGQRVYSAQELAAALAADRGSFIGKAVIVDGKVTPDKPTDCSDLAGSSGVCALGTLDGTREDVVATPYTASLLLPDTDYPTRGLMALSVRGKGLEYLGWMGYVNGVDFTASIADLAHPEEQARGPETVIISAYLGTSGPLPCPFVPGSPPPADTPFETCPTTWLAATSALATDGGMPDGAVRVQYGAYAEYAGNPAISSEPTEGTFLVRLVTDIRGGPNGPRGWQVVGRLSP